MASMPSVCGELFRWNDQYLVIFYPAKIKVILIVLLPILVFCSIIKICVLHFRCHLVHAHRILCTASGTSLFTITMTHGKIKTNSRDGDYTSL